MAKAFGFQLPKRTQSPLPLQDYLDLVGPKSVVVKLGSRSPKALAFGEPMAKAFGFQLPKRTQSPLPLEDYLDLKLL